IFGRPNSLVQIPFSYSNLKKLIYQIEKDKVSGTLTQQRRQDAENGVADEHTTLMDASSRANSIFVPGLDRELRKIVNFYNKKEKELYEQVTLLEADVEDVERLDEGDQNLRRSSADTSGPSNARQSTYTRQLSRARSRSSASLTGRPVWQRRESFIEGTDTELPPNIITNNTEETDPEIHNTDSLWSDFEVQEHRLIFKRRAVDLFVLLSELKSYVNLNLTAFSKILKKYDKITNNELKKSYIPNVVNAMHPFNSNTKQRLNDQIAHVEQMYAHVVTDGDTELAINELKAHLREHIVWERNTVWRDMIGLERKQQAVGVRDARYMVNEAKGSLSTPFGKMNLDWEMFRKWATFVGCLVVFVALLNIKVFSGIEENNCFALLVFASLLWATEAMPLFVTSLMIPLLVVTLRVMRSDDGYFTRLDAPNATKRIFATMFSPVIMLLLGGFALAAALSKYHIAKALATIVLSKAGTRPSRVLLANMMVATVASMWISNVAAPVLCFSLIQPILRTLPNKSPFARCLILGIALASNVGGMASPISSPQNIIAIENMNPAPTWLEWFFISLPLCLISNLIIWMLLLWHYKPEHHTPQIHAIRASNDPINRTQVFIVFITLLTIVLWCLEHSFENVLGDMGIIAIVPLVAFFGTGILSKEDFNNFLWTVIILAMGGIALGKAVQSSGLLLTIARHIQSLVQGLTLFEVLFVFASLIVVIATFISHTVAALIILPIVAQVGAGLPDPHPRLLVMGSALVCSAAMGLPVSGFPNMNAIMMEDEMGVQYLNTLDFIRNGVPSSLLAMLCITTVGYGLMKLIGF
ncbi:SPX domain-containing protein, partial [Endogone sp. FLAS-F59071]